MASAAREPSAGGHDIEVSVVVPCRGHADSLAELLDDLAHQRTVCRFEVLVADAGPDEAVRAVAESRGAMTVRQPPIHEHDLLATVHALLGQSMRPGMRGRPATALLP
jgi:hypothetical protein